MLLAATLIWAIALRPTAVRPVLADGPSPSPQVGDTRSSGEGAGAAGDPLGAVQALVVVLGLGLGAAGATVLYVRLSRRGS